MNENTSKGKAVTIFSGVGASSHALREAGYDVVAHDIMPEAVETLRSNGFTARNIDVRDIDWGDPEYDDVQVLIGGPPCQPFSQAHDGDGEYDPRDMIPEFIRAVNELRPATFVMEEVKTLTWKKHAAYLGRIVADLRGLGYTVDHKVLDSSDYGSGQARKRLFIVGRRNAVEKRPNGAALITPEVTWPNHCPDFARQTMAQALGWYSRTAWERNQEAPEPARVGGSTSEERIKWAWKGKEGTAPAWVHPALDWVYSRPSTTVVGSFRPEVQAAPGYRKAGDGPRQNTLGSVVTTLEERLILQGLPHDWTVCGSKAKQDLQVGNSCPTQMLSAIIEANEVTA